MTQRSWAWPQCICLALFPPLVLHHCLKLILFLTLPASVLAIHALHDNLNVDFASMLTSVCTGSYMPMV